jgi:hypothetical protein|tara:strand:- start:436 stop:927 length:492 start_codon:yes stop_codon:yes gene_type:complete
MISRSKKKKSQSDLGPEEKLKHGEYTVEETMIPGVLRLRNREHDPLDRCLNRNQITRKQYDAGVRFQKDFYIARMTPYFASPNLSGLRLGPIADSADRVIMARDRVQKAISQLGVMLTDCAINIVGSGHSAADWAKGKNIASRSGIDILRLALSELAKHYRLT